MRLRNGKVVNMAVSLDLNALKSILGENIQEEMNPEQILEAIKKQIGQKDTDGHSSHSTNENEQNAADPTNSVRNCNHRNKILEDLRITVPKFSGDQDCFQFLDELDHFVKINSLTDEQILKNLLPVALTDDPLKWFYFASPFSSVKTFRHEFLLQFKSFHYQAEIKRELQTKVQTPTETLASFVRDMYYLYHRLPTVPSEKVIVGAIISKSHPKFRTFLYNKDINTVKELEKLALEIQSLLLDEYLYSRQLDAHKTNQTFPVAAMMPLKEKECFELHPKALIPALFKRSHNVENDQQSSTNKMQSRVKCTFCGRNNHNISQCRIKLRNDQQVSAFARVQAGNRTQKPSESN